MLHTDPRQPRRGALPQKLDRLENRGHLVIGSFGAQQQVHMFGRKHISSKGKSELLACRIDGVSQPFTSPLGSKERKTAKTGKRQFVGMARFVGRWPTHAPLGPVHKYS